MRRAGDSEPRRRPAEAPARESDRAAASSFRRHWTWRDQMVVHLAGAAIAVVIRLVYATLRLRVDDPQGLLARRNGGGPPVLVVAWHDGIALLPLVLRRAGRGFRPRVLLSWHRDAEIAAQAVRRFGVRVVRGSSTRGWLGGVRGLLAAHARGEDLVVVPDGPRGPRHVAKEGVLQLARATGADVLIVGVAARPLRRLRSWDRLQIPLPFARVVAVIAGLALGDDVDAMAGLAHVQAALDGVTRAAAVAVGDGAPTT